MADDDAAAKQRWRRLGRRVYGETRGAEEPRCHRAHVEPDPHRLRYRAGLREIESLALPKTWTVQSSAPSKRHFYFRPPLEAAQLPKVGFRFEEDGFTADKNRYLVCPPALHPSGVVYRFLHGPFDGTPIGVMPLDVYQELVRRGDEAEKQLDTRLHTTEPGEKVTAGHRRESVFRHACMQRRWGLSAAAITDACMGFNLERCEPPLTRDQVAHQVEGAMRFAGGEELTTAPPAYDGPPRDLDDVVAAFRRYLHLPDATPLLVVLAAVVANRMSEGDPVWVVIIGGSSRGMTELLMALDGLPGIRITGALTPPRCSPERVGKTRRRTRPAAFCGNSVTRASS